MKVFTFACLLLIIASCTAPQPTPEPRAPTTTPTTLAQSTATLSPTERPSTPAAQLSAAPAFASSVLLNLRRREEASSYFPQPPWMQRYHDEIHLVDPATGQDVPGYAPINGLSAIVSADSRRLIAIESRGQLCESMSGGTACYASADVLHLLDLQTWREVTTTTTAKGLVSPYVFSPDSTRLALSYQERRSSTLMVLEASTGRLVAQRALSLRPSRLSYSQDGAMLVVYGQPLSSDPGMTQADAPRVLLADAATLDVKWEQPLANVVSGSWCLEHCQASHEQQLFASWTPAVVASRDGRRLHIVHADAERLTTVDFDARSVRTVEIRAAQSWFERLLDPTARVAEAKGGENGAHKTAVLSLDGTRLYLLGQTYQATRTAQGNWDTQYETMGLHVVEVASGRRLARYETEAKGIKITPDEVHLLLDDWDGRQWWTEVLDAGSLQRVAHLDKWEVVVARRMNGQPILLARDPYHQPMPLAVLDPRTFEVIHSWSVDANAWWVTSEE